MRTRSWPALGLLALAACAPKLARFPDQAPMWVDADENHVAEQPAEYWSGLMWDGADQTVFKPLDHALLLDIPGPAANVNAWDEVPDSSWFHNRIGVRDMSQDEVAIGACPDRQVLDIAGPWTVKGAKPNGANPGFIIKGPQGRYFLLKFDGHDQPERATTADVLGSKVYHAAGYHSPCNSVVFFDPSILVMDPEASSEDELGREVPLTREDIDKVLAAAVVLPDGSYRASASLFLSGRPLGPWRYQSTRKDDPNDVIRHEDRRELRGAKVLAAWLNHFDAREQNTLAMWTEEDGRSFVRHYYIDFGDCLGSRWEEQDDALSRRFGFSYYFDIGHVLGDLAALGAIERPWETVDVRPSAPILGYFDVAHFEPTKWRAGYPNPAFDRMQDEDAAWMARIIANLSEEHVRAMLDEAHMSDAGHKAEVLRILLARRQAVLDTYLRVRSPLAEFRVEGGTEVCFTDLAARTGVTDPRFVRYEGRMYFGDFDQPAWTRIENPVSSLDPAEICVPLVESGQRPVAGGYAILDLLAHDTPGAEPLPPARLHFYDKGEEGFRLVGIERPADATTPLME